MCRLQPIPYNDPEFLHQFEEFNFDMYDYHVRIKGMLVYEACEENGIWVESLASGTKNSFA